MTKRIGGKDIAIVFWRMFWAFAFYPIIIGLIIWLYFKGAHWGWGLALVAIMLTFDPIWRLILRRMFRRK